MLVDVIRCWLLVLVAARCVLVARSALCGRVLAAVGFLAV